MALRPVNSQKHVVDSQGGIVLNTHTQIRIIRAQDNPTLANTADVATASVVKAIYLNVQVSATTAAALANVYMYVSKNPGNAIAGATFPDGNAVGASFVKKLIFHQEMTMMQKDIVGNPKTLFVGVLKIPKHMQRMGQNDEVEVELFAPGVNIDFCIQCIYKEFK